jgi:hypothetical protein
MAKQEDTNQQPYITAVLVIVIFILGAALIMAMREQSDDAKRPVQVTKALANKQLIIDANAYLADYHGLLEKDATAKAKADGLTARVVSDESKGPLAITDDLRNDRLNFTIRVGRVAEVELY